MQRRSPLDPSPLKLLVTGGAGFIGSALVRRLLQEGVAVVVVDALTYAGHKASLSEVEDHPDYAFVRADIADAAALAAIFAAHDPDGVIHLAAETHVDRSITGPAAFIRTNIVGTQVLLEAALAHFRTVDPSRRDRFRFLHISTDEVFGQLGTDGLFDETSRYDPRSPYAASKAASDHLVRAWGHTFDLPVIVTNCSNNYGPRQMPEKLVPLMILNALHGDPLPVYGDGSQVRDWLHVEDHARALLLVYRSGEVGASYAIGARCERQNADTVRLICATLDRLLPDAAPHARLIRHVADRPGHDRRYAIDPGRIEARFGWRPEISFEAGIEATIRWYLDNRSWWEPLRAAGHGTTRLGLDIPRLDASRQT